MNPSPKPIRIARAKDGHVEVDGAFDAFAGHILLRAGFLSLPSLNGRSIRLPLDMGHDWENEQSTWAAQMLVTARYPVRLDPGLDTRLAPPDRLSGPGRPPAMAAQACPTRAACR
ncbi:hypothetical protein ACF08M_34630 [Streptomyces sp. NPDC015032]|uniref:hypothetical protein n=1 Tax=Streptomyces sp. NPDC015032 TaxID=3364937 RepID=UPI0036F76998